MSWKYRVVRRTWQDDIQHYIAAYNDGDGYYTNPISAHHYDEWGGDPIESLREQLQSMILVLDKPVIDGDEL